MPKMKTHRGAAKRFSRSAGGVFKHRRAFRNHILTKKSGKRKRRLRADVPVRLADQRSLERLLPYC